MRQVEKPQVFMRLICYLKNSIITYHLFCSKSHSLEQFTAVLLLLGDDYHMSHFTLSLVKTHCIGYHSGSTILKPLWRGAYHHHDYNETHWLIQANPPVAGLDAYVNANEKLN